jgi:hypothetical protein
VYGIEPGRGSEPLVSASRGIRASSGKPAVGIWGKLGTHKSSQGEGKKPDLGIELDVGCSQAHEACEEGLVQVAVLLEGHVFDHGGQLMVITNQDDPFQPTHSILLPLQISTSTDTPCDPKSGTVRNSGFLYSSTNGVLQC